MSMLVPSKQLQKRKHRRWQTCYLLPTHLSEKERSYRCYNWKDLESNECKTLEITHITLVIIFFSFKKRLVHCFQNDKIVSTVMIYTFP
jgi:hypothetical protein